MVNYIGAWYKVDKKFANQAILDNQEEHEQVEEIINKEENSENVNKLKKQSNTVTEDSDQGQIANDEQNLFLKLI